MDELSAHNSSEKRLIEKAGRMQLPIMATFELTPVCNLKCRMCYVRRNSAEVEACGGLYSVEKWISLAEILQRRGILFITLTGGEPLLFPGFEKLCRTLSALGMIYTINTNATLIDDRWAAFLREVSPRRINVTLYGASAASYRGLCGSDKAFEQAIRGIRLLKAYDLPVKINSSITNENFADLDQIYRIGEDLNCPVHTDTYMIPRPDHRDKENLSVRLSPEKYALAEYQVLKNEMSEAAFDHYIDGILSGIESGSQYPSGISCLAGNCSFCISWTGSMKACVSMGKSYVRVFEELTEENVDRAWKEISSSSKLLKMNQKCCKCRLRPLCKNCVASAYLECGDYNAIPDYLCRCSEELYKKFKEHVSARSL